MLLLCCSSIHLPTIISNINRHYTPRVHSALTHNAAIGHCRTTKFAIIFSEWRLLSTHNGTGSNRGGGGDPRHPPFIGIVVVEIGKLIESINYYIWSMPTRHSRNQNHLLILPRMMNDDDEDYFWGANRTGLEIIQVGLLAILLKPSLPLLPKPTLDKYRPSPTHFLSHFRLATAMAVIIRRRAFICVLALEDIIGSSVPGQTALQPSPSSSPPPTHPAAAAPPFPCSVHFQSQFDFATPVLTL